MNSWSIFALILFPLVLVAQAPRDVAPLKYWPAPLYWQPTHEESVIVTKPGITAAAEMNPPATTPAGALVFVAMTPCRLVDTRAGFGFTGAFGPPSLVGGATRSFPLQTSTTCTIPSNAQAYSLNLTIVPPAVMYYLTIWPVGATQPNVSTLNDLLGTVIANAAIVPAGNDGSGSVNVFVSNNTDFIMDINGYYAPQTGLTLSQGSLGAPSVSFGGDPTTGIYSSTAGVVNIATGGQPALSLGTLNTAVGTEALGAGSTGTNNTATGRFSLYSNTTGAYNTANGASALTANTTGAQNTAVGFDALASNTSTNSNVAVGYQALQKGTGNNNTATGAQALQSDGGDYNTANGYLALASNTSGTGNTAVGNSALQSNKSGSWNTAVGSGALAFSPAGTSTAVGAGALYNFTQGTANTAVGYDVLWHNTGGNSNVAVGDSALFYSTGNNNVAVGASALSTFVTGDNNIGLGTNAGSNNAGGSNNIYIGSAGGGPNESNTIRIGDDQNQNYTSIAGIYNSPIMGGVPALITINGWMTANPSSRRYKEDIQDMAEASSGLLKLRPVTFRYKRPYADGSKPIDYGLIAEEVAEVYPDLVVKNADGQVETVQYQKLTPMLLNELQKQYEHGQRQDEAIRLLQDEVAALKALVAAKPSAAGGVDPK